MIACEPDGVNINAGCGSTHMDPLVERMREGGHDIGFAFDGDGDRVLAVDRDGSVVDGDEIIAADRRCTCSDAASWPATASRSR